MKVIICRFPIVAKLILQKILELQKIICLKIKSPSPDRSRTPYARALCVFLWAKERL
jgi:hypothetical protein